jgi:hypothetical protein
MKSVNFTPGNFTNPQDLSRQVDNLAQNVDLAFRRLSRFFQPILTPSRPVETKYSAAPNELVFVDAVTEDRMIVLPKTLAGISSIIGIVGINIGAHNVTLTSIQGSINGVDSFVLPISNRLTLLISDGSGWWSTGG